MKKLILLTILVFAAAACSKEKIERIGTVTEKQYIPEKTETRTTIFNTGKSLMPIVRTVQIPEKHTLKVSYIITEEKILEVSKEEYEKAVIGKPITFKE